jgi:hypothetical protein
MDATIANETARGAGSNETVAARRVLFTLLIASLAAGACEDPFATTASAEVRIDSFVVYAASGTPVNVPAAFSLLLFTPVRLEPTYNFDVVFDIDDAGNVVLIPVTLAGGAVTADRSVGLQRIVGAYDDMTRAPADVYEYDYTLALAPTEGAVIQVKTSACADQASELIYAKLQIKTVDPATRVLAFRISYNPNCGYRSFLAGLPTN